MEVAAEGLDDLLRLAFAQEPVVDEDAGELAADRLVYEQRRDRGVDAARERAEDALRADRSSDAGDLLLDDRGGRPCRRRGGHLVQEVLEDLLPVRRVHDLGMELHAVQPPFAILEGRDRRGRRRRGHARARRRSRDGVAVAHPYRRSGGRPCEVLGLVREICLAELRRAGALDGAAEIARHQLHAVADAERRDAEREDLRVELRRTLRVHGSRAAREDERRRVPRRQLGSRQPVSHELGVHARLTDTPCDELAVLAAEIHDEDRTVLRRGLRRRERDDLGQLNAGSSVRPS